jgi:glutathione synthase/RimK-type ligase-like ATP-grasp enzyme
MMPILIVVNNAGDFDFQMEGVKVITAQDYLTEKEHFKIKGARVFNLCNAYRYQSTGYYVSLLAAARGHKAVPDITTIQDTKAHSIVRIKCDELEQLMQKSLASVSENDYTLNIYFGKSIDPEFRQLSEKLFFQFQAPLIKAHFLRFNGKWNLHQLGLLSAGELMPEDKKYVVDSAREFFNAKRFTLKKPAIKGYELAILVNPDEKEPPSNKMAIKRFIMAASSLGINATTITKDEYNHIGEYDALLIRETTSVNHYTYRFSRRAAVEGLVVMDDPESILKCCNKVYLAELLERNNILTPRTIVLNKENINKLTRTYSFPLIIKQPDSAFSLGVKKISNTEELLFESKKMFEKSDLIIAQEFFPTEFDWRIGIVNGTPIYACKYYMADNHWQIINSKRNGSTRYGKCETFSIEEVPDYVLNVAVKAANLIGKGLYGVDMKEVDGKGYVIEVNDNPNIDAGVEDKILKNNLYEIIMQIYLERIQKIKNHVKV